MSAGRWGAVGRVRVRQGRRLCRPAGRQRRKRDLRERLQSSHFNDIPLSRALSPRHPAMADARQLSCGLRGSCKSARQGLGFPASEPDAIGTPRPYLPLDILRLIDAIMRTSERAEMLRAMHGGDLGLTLYDAAHSGGLLDVRFLLAAGADAGAEDGRALYAACNGDHIQVAEALLDAGGTLTPRHCNWALRNPALAGRTACCKLLLDRGADIHHQESFGCTVLRCILRPPGDGRLPPGSRCRCLVRASSGVRHSKPTPRGRRAAAGAARRRSRPVIE